MPTNPVTTEITPSAQAITAAGARWLMTGLAGVLVAQGVSKPEDASGLIEVGSGLLIGLATLAWSYLQKRAAKRAVIQALDLSPGSTLADLAKVTPVPL